MDGLSLSSEFDSRVRRPQLKEIFFFLTLFRVLIFLIVIYFVHVLDLEISKERHTKGRF